MTWTLLPGIPRHSHVVSDGKPICGCASYDDVQLSAVLVRCVGPCGRLYYATHPAEPYRCPSCRQRGRG